MLAWIACRTGGVDRAAALLAEALPLARGLGAPAHTANTLFFAGDATIHADQIAEGVRLTAAACRHEAYTTRMLFQDEQDEHAAAMGLARAALGDGTFERLWAEGRAMTDDQAFAAAREALAAIVARQKTIRAGAPPAAAAVT